MLPTGFSIRLYLPDATASGVQLLTKSNWTGRGVVCPRSLFSQEKGRPEFDGPGVYVLIGESEEGELPRVYVGQSEQLAVRLEQHHKQQDFWTRAVFFTASDDSLSGSHVRYLEHRLIALAQKAKRAHLENATNPGLPSMSEADRADAESFLTDVRSILPVVGVRVFETPLRSPAKSQAVLYVKAKGVEARGIEAGAEFVVLKGSQAVAEETASIPDYVGKARSDLKEQGVLIAGETALRFAQDYAFSSPSKASAVVLGASSNGLAAWQDAQGRTLKIIQAST